MDPTNHAGSNPPQPPTVPFSIEVYEGLGAAEGLLRLDRESLVLEFEVKDNLIGVLRSGVKRAVIPLREIDRIALEKGWIGARFVLRTSSLQAVENLPGHERGQVRLSISRKDFDAARKLVSALAEHLDGRVSLQSRDRLRRRWAQFRDWLADL